MGKTCSTCGSYEKCVQNFSQEIRRHRWKDNVKVDFTEIGCDIVGWFHVAQD